MLKLFGLLGGLFGLASCIPYLRDTLALRVKPQRTSFFIWSVLGTIAFVSQLAKGATNTLWLPGLETIGVMLTFCLSIKYGTGGFGKKDYAALIVSAIGLLAWYITKEALIALYLVIIVDFTGLVLTLHKAYVEPDTEAYAAWVLATIGGALSLFAVGTINIVFLSYPFYIMAANLAVVIAIKLGRQNKMKSKLI